MLGLRRFSGLCCFYYGLTGSTLDVDRAEGASFSWRKAYHAVCAFVFSYSCRLRMVRTIHKGPFWRAFMCAFIRSTLTEKGREGESQSSVTDRPRVMVNFLRHEINVFVLAVLSFHAIFEREKFIFISIFYDKTNLKFVHGGIYLFFHFNHYFSRSTFIPAPSCHSF